MGVGEISWRPRKALLPFRQKHLVQISIGAFQGAGAAASRVRVSLGVAAIAHHAPGSERVQQIINSYLVKPNCDSMDRQISSQKENPMKTGCDGFLS